jgi:hypothetical protein
MRGGISSRHQSQKKFGGDRCKPAIPPTPKRKETLLDWKDQGHHHSGSVSTAEPVHVLTSFLGSCTGESFFRVPYYVTRHPPATVAAKPCANHKTPTWKRGFSPPSIPQPHHSTNDIHSLRRRSIYRDSLPAISSRPTSLFERISNLAIFAFALWFDSHTLIPPKWFPNTGTSAPRPRRPPVHSSEVFFIRSFYHRLKRASCLAGPFITFFKT